MIRLRRFLATVGRVAIASSMLVALTAPDAMARAPVTVLATRAYELNPAASSRHVAWDIRSRGSWNAYVKRFGGKRIHVNHEGTSGSVGSIDGTRLVYQQWTYTARRRDSDIYI